MSAVKRIEELKPEDFQDAQEQQEIPQDELTVVLWDIVDYSNQAIRNSIKPEEA